MELGLNYFFFLAQSNKDAICFTVSSLEFGHTHNNCERECFFYLLVGRYRPTGGPEILSFFEKKIWLKSKIFPRNFMISWYHPTKTENFLELATLTYIKNFHFLKNISKKIFSVASLARIFCLNIIIILMEFHYLCLRLRFLNFSPFIKTKPNFQINYFFTFTQCKIGSYLFMHFKTIVDKKFSNSARLRNFYYNQPTIRKIANWK